MHLEDGGSLAEYITLVGGQGGGQGGGGNDGPRRQLALDLEHWLGRRVLMAVRPAPFEIIIILDEGQFTAGSGLWGGGKGGIIVELRGDRRRR